MPGKLHAVTGAASYTGRYLTPLLTARGDRVRNLTRLGRRPAQAGEDAHELDFGPRSAAALEGVDTLFCTSAARDQPALGNFCPSSILRSRF